MDYDLGIKLDKLQEDINEIKMFLQSMYELKQEENNEEEEKEEYETSNEYKQKIMGR